MSRQATAAVLALPTPRPASRSSKVWRIPAAQLSGAEILPPRGFSGAIDFALPNGWPVDNALGRPMISAAGDTISLGPWAKMPSGIITASIVTVAASSPAKATRGQFIRAAYIWPPMVAGRTGRAA
jgi:hypothetical protein